MATDSSAKVVSNNIDIKSAKIALKVSRTALTKSITKLELAAKDLQKNELASKAKQLRLAASLLEAQEILKTKVKKMEAAHDVTIQAILNEDEDKLSKKKDELVDEYEAEMENYMENSIKVQVDLEARIEKADERVGLELQLLSLIQQSFHPAPQNSETNRGREYNKFVAQCLLCTNIRIGF